MRTLSDFDSGTKHATLLVFLPPAMTTLEDIVERGFIAAMRTRNIAADVLLAEITHEHVMQQRVAGTLRETVIAPALARGYRQIWLAGISLGAFNALHYAAQFADDVTGLCLLAPYPGTGDILREIGQAGGPAAWAAKPGQSRSDEREWWHWLWQESQAGSAAKPIYVGLSASDRFLHGQQMLAKLLPSERIDLIPGTHDWPAWFDLWQRWLDRGWLDRSSL
ncbi:MAG: alpha/beta hydrolase [Spongiibacteraceae bacterium]